ncbi:MAG TPA: DUF6519 domain-containing protein [Polyangiales bacterium]|nr:DUF6519 domain-containing protein [Polyangiales bacterium]
MRGDFSIDRFDRSKHFNRVLKQQGRVDLEADWNEQASIAAHHMRTMLVDLVGSAAGPVGNAGFGVVDWANLTDAQKKELAAQKLEPEMGNFLFRPGRYYVNGLLVENERFVSFTEQPDWHAERLKAGTYLVYLDVFEHQVTYLEDDSIREIALGGPDTCTRVKTTWQVKVLALSNTAVRTKKDDKPKQVTTKKAKQPHAAREGDGSECDLAMQPLRQWQSGKLRPRLDPGETVDDPCVLAPESRYRGLENQLYRIEIHRGSDNSENKPATFKWSRENGSVATRWVGEQGKSVRVKSSRGFAAGDWVELSDAAVATPVADTLYQILSVDGDLLQLSAAPPPSSELTTPLVRRWDQQADEEIALDDGAISVEAAKAGDGFIEIESGIEVQFEAGPYRTGDYWLIPARVVSGDIVWPRDGKDWKQLPPHGVQHHYAPLARVELTGTENFVTVLDDCRCLFMPLACMTEQDP